MFIDVLINVKDIEVVFEFVFENILMNDDFIFDNFCKVFDVLDFWFVLWVLFYYMIVGIIGVLVMGLFVV